MGKNHIKSKCYKSRNGNSTAQRMEACRRIRSTKKTSRQREDRKRMTPVVMAFISIAIVVIGIALPDLIKIYKMTNKK